VSTQTISNIMLHSPPDAYHTSSSAPAHHNSSRGQQVPRSYNTHSVGVPYRGPSSTPVAPYAFQSTPHLRQDNRTVSAPYRQSTGSAVLSSNRQSYAPSSSESTASSTSASNSSSNGGHYSASKDDSVLIGQRPSSQSGPRASFLTSSSTPDLSLTNFDTSAKPSPDRYRRVQRRADSSPSVPTLQQNPGSQKHSPPSSRESPPAQSDVSRRALQRVSLVSTNSMDETQMPRQLRYKRRSVVEPSLAATPLPPTVTQAPPTWSQVVARGHSGPVNPVISAPSARPISYHQRKNSGNSTSSTNSTNAKRPATVS
jgi:hypothetical protein